MENTTPEHLLTQFSGGSSFVIKQRISRYAELETADKGGGGALQATSTLLPRSEILSDSNIRRNLWADVTPSLVKSAMMMTRHPFSEKGTLSETADWKHKICQVSSSSGSPTLVVSKTSSCSSAIIKESEVRTKNVEPFSTNSGYDFRQQYDWRLEVTDQRPKFGSSELEGKHPFDDRNDKGNGSSQVRPTAANLHDLSLSFSDSIPTSSAESPALEQRAPILESTHNAASHVGTTVERENSLAIVPFTGDRHFQPSSQTPGLRYRQFSLTPNDQQGLRFPPASDQFPVLTIGAPSVGGNEISNDKTATSNLKRGAISPRQEGRSKWVVMSAEQVEHAAKKLRGETDKNKTLQAKLEKHKHDRVLIYDAAMKQATEREEEGVKEVKRTFEREKIVMRAEVDQEVVKVNDLYEKRCRDYAQMVSDECEEEISTASAELRKDWARQKKTIAQLVREGAGKDRQVAVIARAVMEHLLEEKMDEAAAMRTDIYTEVQMEFENRERTLRDALQSEFRADLDGQLLLAEIRHQKEIDNLRIELRGDHAPPTGVAGEAIVLFNRGLKLKRGDVESAKVSDPGPNRSTPSPSLLRHSRQQQQQQQQQQKNSRHRQHRQKKPFRSEAAGNWGNDSGVSRAATVGGKSGLVKKLPIFRTPSQKASTSDLKKTSMKSDRLSKPTSQRRPRIKSPSWSPKTGNLSSTFPEPLDCVFQHEDEEFDGNITSALTVSPTKAPGIVVTPSISIENVLVEEAASPVPQRPKKRGKRLFTPQA